MGIVAYMDMLDGRNYILYYLMAEVSKGTQIMEEVRKMIDRAITVQERHIDGYRDKINKKIVTARDAHGPAVTTINKQIELFDEKIQSCKTAIEALERMRPEDAVFKDGVYTCVFCSRALNEVYRICSDENAPAAFCPFCGQAQGFKIGDSEDSDDNSE